MQSPNRPSLGVDESIALAAALLTERASAVTRPARYAIAFAEGQRFVLSTKRGEGLARGFSRDADVTILTDGPTFSDLLLGRFDPSDAEPQHLFTWGGDQGALTALSQLLGGRQTLLRLRGGR